MKVKLRRNRHNMSNYQCGTGFPGEIIPVGWDEVLPGDSYQFRLNGLIRFAAMNAPIMHRVHAEYFTFYCPTRVLWDEFEAMITRSDIQLPPTMTLGDIKADADCKRLFEYFGVNTDSVVVGSTTPINVLLAQMYYKTWNEWFRDKDLQTILPETSVTASDYQVQRACWRKDKLTMARPFAQYGAAVTLPLGTSAPVTVTEAERYSGTGAPEDLNFIRTSSTGGAPDDQLETSTSATNPGNVRLTGTADLSAASSATVIQWRRAMNLQALAERLQNFGHDYRSYLASMGVQSDDGRLQKPELIGSGKVPISFSEVLQTAEGATTGVGDLYGHGIAAAHNHPFKRFFKEHGYVMTVMVIRPQAIYNNTIPRQFFHGLVDGANDYYTPELERIGFQEIYSKEIYPTEPAAGDEDVWGYVPRYDEYRHVESKVTGLFKVGASLDHWTWARGFTGGTAPALNSVFVECNPDSRIFQDTASQPILFCVNNINIAQRMITKNITGRII